MSDMQLKWDLPNELYARIFQYIDTISMFHVITRVCQTWRSMSEDCNAWSTVSFPFSIAVTFSSIRCAYYVHRWCEITILNLSGARLLCDLALSYVARECQQLQYIRLDRCVGLSDMTLYHLSRGKAAPRLLSISMARCERITDTGISHLIRCPSLTSLRFTECEELRGTGISTIAPHCQQLQKISLSGCTELNDIPIQNLSQYANRLHTLHVKGCDALTADVGRYIGRMSSLTDLALAGCHAINDTAIINIAAGCSYLHILNMSNCDHITDASLHALSQHCHQLSAFVADGVSAITDQGMQALATGCPNLRFILLNGCRRITDFALLALASSCHDLHTLSIAKCKQCSDTGIQHLAGGCPSLTSLDVTACHRITRQGLQYLPARTQVTR